MYYQSNINSYLSPDQDHFSFIKNQTGLTIKVLINTQAFIRIITFHGEGDGRLLEASVLKNYSCTTKNLSVCFL